MGFFQGPAPIEAYFSPAMLEDPWAKLRTQGEAAATHKTPSTSAFYRSPSAPYPRPNRSESQNWRGRDQGQESESGRWQDPALLSDSLVTQVEMEFKLPLDGCMSTCHFLA